MAGVNDATLKVNVLTTLEKSQIERNLKDVQDTFGKKPIKMKADASQEKATGEAEGGTMFSGIVSSLKSIGEVALGIFGAISIVVAIVTHFKQIISLIKLIIKIILEFLRPIADIIMVLLMPLLVMLKPIIVVFRALMAPFRKAAMQMSGAGLKAISQGNIGEGFTLSMSAFNVLLTGFNAAVLGLISQILKAGLDAVGELTKLIMSPVWLIAELIGKVIDYILPGVDGVEQKIRDAHASFNNAIDTGISFIEAQIDNILGGYLMQNLATIDEILTNLLGPSGDAMLNLKDFGTVINSVFTDATVNFTTLGGKLEESQGILSDLSVTFFTLLAQLKTDATEVVKILSGQKQTPFGMPETLPTKSPLSSMNMSFDSVLTGTAFDPNNPLGLKNAMSSAADIGTKSLWERLSENFSSKSWTDIALQATFPFLTGLETIKTLVDYWMGNSPIPDAFNLGMVKINEIVTEGNTNMVTAYEKMSLKTNDFANNIDIAAQKISAASIMIEAAARRAATAARVPSKGGGLGGQIKLS